MFIDWIGTDKNESIMSPFWTRNVDESKKVKTVAEKEMPRHL